MPNGWGQQKLYDVKIEYQENGVTPSVILEEKIGFRTVELVEDDLQSIHTFRFLSLQITHLHM
jgi:beta-galactosidase/beta-glucuronidase